ncbi:MAG: protein phosphatase 2C domain-containing protein [Anaerolineae bacterium]|nr:protein phosphatase 2C domain-containing protein [Anaerolineae bacterium]
MADGFRFPLTIHGQTDVGKKRSRNEDAMRHHLPKPTDSEFKHGALALVCDGMGGVGKGDVASQTAVETIFRVYYNPDDPEIDTRARLRRAIVAAHNAVQSRAREFGMMYIGSTAAGLAIMPDGRGVVFNLGDSRVYRLRGGKLQQISKDQSILAAQLERGEITEEQAKASRNMNITAFIGHPFELDIVFNDVEVAAGDMFLLCSDGLWDVVREPDLQAALNSKTEDAALHYFIHETLERGAPDNVTAIIVSTRAPKRNVPSWVYGLVGVGVVAIGAFLVLNSGLVSTSAPAPLTASMASTQTATLPPTAEEEATQAVTELPPTSTEAPPTATDVPATPTDVPPTESPATQAEVAATEGQAAAAQPSETPRQATSTPTRQPTATASNTPLPSETPSPTPPPSATPTRTATPTDTASPTPPPSDTPTETAPPSDTPSATPSRTPRPSSTPRPSATPTDAPTSRPTRTPRPTDIPQPTPTLNPTILSDLGTPAAALELVPIVPINGVELSPILVYSGDLTEANARQIPHPTDPSLILTLVRIRPGVLGSESSYYYRLDNIAPQIEVLTESGIILHETDSIASPRVGALAVGTFAEVIGISPRGNWFLVQSRTARGWVTRTLENSGDITFLGDLDDVPIIQPFKPEPLPNPDGTTPPPGNAGGEGGGLSQSGTPAP